VCHWLKESEKQTRKVCRDETRVRIAARGHVRSLAPGGTIGKD